MKRLLIMLSLEEGIGSTKALKQKSASQCSGYFKEATVAGTARGGGRADGVRWMRRQG